MSSDIASALFLRAAKVWDETKVTRHGKGDARGGQFAPKHGGGSTPQSTAAQPAAKPAPETPKRSKVKPRPADAAAPAKPPKPKAPITPKKPSPLVERAKQKTQPASKPNTDAEWSKFESKIKAATQKASELKAVHHLAAAKPPSELSLSPAAATGIHRAAQSMSPEERSKMASMYEQLAATVRAKSGMNLDTVNEIKADPSKAGLLSDQLKNFHKKAVEFQDKAHLWAFHAMHPDETAKPVTAADEQTIVPFDELVELETSNADVTGAKPEDWDSLDYSTREWIEEQWIESRLSDDSFLEYAYEGVRESIDVRDMIDSNIDDLLDDASWDDLDVGQNEVSDQIENVVKNALNSGAAKVGKEMSDDDRNTLRTALEKDAPNWKDGSLSDEQRRQLIEDTLSALNQSEPDEVNLLSTDDIGEIIQIDHDDAVDQFYEAWRRGDRWASEVDSLLNSEIESRMDDYSALRDLAQDEFNNLGGDYLYEWADSAGMLDSESGGGGGDLSDYGIDDPASFFGAPEGSTVKVEGNIVEIVGPGGFAMQRQLDGETINAMYFKVGKQFKGNGSQIFAQMVRQARANGQFRQITTYAAGSFGDRTYNGYYTWPLLGYDYPIMNLRRSVEANLREQFPDESIETIQDLFATPGGRDWWYVNGSGMDGMYFDLEDGSRSMKVLEGYLNERRTKS